MGTKVQEKTFAKFAILRFENSHFISYERKPLTQPLLKFSSPLDEEAARAVSLAILRYTEQDLYTAGSYSNKSLYRQLVSGLQQGSKDGKFSPYSLLQGRMTTDLDKVHFICGMGILGTQLRDEIYCQICKQINGNPSEKSRQKAWTLLACCICSFLPSEFLPYLENILKSAPQVERRFCEEKLRRTILNGNRSEPPSSMDHQAIRNRGSFSHIVWFMDGQVCKLPLDSATTGIELRKKINAAKGLVDLFGFSFQVKIGDRVSKIVGGTDHVMDVISCCEQIGKELDMVDVCALVFFKEIFSPWQNPAIDSKATKLIYSQMISSIKLNRYTLTEDITLAKMVALHSYVLHGANAGKKDMEETVNALIPKKLITQKNSKAYWIQMAASYFDKKYRHDKGMNRKKAIEILANHAKHNMTDDFSRYFNLLSVHGPNNVGNASVLSVNWQNIGVHQSQPTLATWSLTFPEMKKVSYERMQGRRVGTVTITTIHAKELKLTAPKAEDIHALLNFFLQGLRKRSRYLLALRDHQPTGMGQLGFVHGDLIELKGSCNGETLQTTGRGYGACHRTGSTGEFSAGLFYIIPTLSTPSTALMEMLRNSSIGSEEKSKVNEKLHWLPNPAPAELPEINLTLPSEPSARILKIQEFQKTNTNIFLESRNPDNMINNYDVPSLSSNQVNPVVEKPFNTDQFHVSTTHHAHSNNAKPIQHVELDLKREVGVKTDDYADRLAQFKEGQSFKTSETTLLEFHDKSAAYSESLPASITDGNGDLGPSNLPYATFNPIYEVPSTDDKPSVQEDQLNLHQEYQEKTSESAIDDFEGDLDLLKEEESFKISENTDEKSIHPTSLMKKNARPQRQATILFKDSPSYQAMITYVSQPARDIMSEMKLTDTIFGKPLSNTTSEDKLYLEIIEHIRTEENVTIVERSWELMWLITGLYPCSEKVKDDVISLLRERTDSNSLAKQCYMRLVKMITHGRRTYPPHIAEVQAIQTRMDLINHKVFFPDGSCQSFEVESATTAGHLISVITESIGLKYPSGCGLFFKIGEKVFGAAEEYFFFDFIQHFIEVWRRSDTGSSIPMNYQVFFLRKVWINVIPGMDRVADCRFHYYQELSKYLRGYHKCAKEDCISLAGLIFRAEFGEDTEHLSEIPDMLNKLVPQDEISEMLVDEWQQAIGEAISGNSHCIGDNAKIQFLKELSKLQTFGAAFFRAKAAEPSSLPENLLIAIQKDAFALMTTNDKSVIEKYSFNEIERWSSGGQTFSVDIKTPTETKKLVFQTSLDYQIDDFLTSYIAVYGSEHQEESTTSDDIDMVEKVE